MNRPTVFINYSQKDDQEKDQLLSHLGVLQRAGLIDLWSDDRGRCPGQFYSSRRWILVCRGADGAEPTTGRVSPKTGKSRKLMNNGSVLMKGGVVSPFNDQLWTEYRTALHRFILSRINDPMLAEDIVQDVLVKAYHRLDTLKDQGKILSWLYQITRNVIVDYYRQRRPTEELSESIIVQEMNFGKEVEKELAQCLLPLVKQLPPHYHQAVMLSEIEGLTQQEVAQKQGITLSGAKSRVQRGQHMLKTMLLECCRVELDRRGSLINCEPNKACGNCTEKVTSVISKGGRCH